MLRIYRNCLSCVDLRHSGFVILPARLAIAAIMPSPCDARYWIHINRLLAEIEAPISSEVVIVGLSNLAARRPRQRRVA